MTLTIVAARLEELCHISISLSLCFSFNKELSYYVVIGNKVLPAIKPTSINYVERIIELVPVCFIEKKEVFGDILSLLDLFLWCFLDFGRYLRFHNRFFLLNEKILNRAN
jgi:hypothetical protein